MGLLDALSVGIGAIIGAGIFVLIGIAAGLAGPAMLLSVLISGLSALFTALSFCELSSMLPKAGGVYEYGHTLLHPMIGFLMGWMFISGNIVLGATASQGFGYYLSALIPGVDYKIAAIALVSLTTIFNVLGTKLSALVNDALVIAKVSVLLLLVTIGIWRVNLANFQPFFPNGAVSILQAAALFYFAYIGFPRVSTMAEEVRDPERNIPRAIILALIISTILYLLISFTALGVIGWDELAVSKAPLEEVARRLGVSWIVGIGGLLATSSVVLTSVMGQSRVFFAMARNREVPSLLARVHSRLGTPVNSALFSGCIMLILVTALDISGLAMTTSFLVLSAHALANISAFRAFMMGKESRFRVPLRPFHAISGALLSTLLLLSVDPRAIFLGSSIVAAGAGWYLAYSKLSKVGSTADAL